MRKPALGTLEENGGAEISSGPLYLDYLATTPVDPEVLEAMIPYFTEEFGNPSSGSHRYGWNAKNILEDSRQSMASNLGAKPTEIIFTSGASESNNFALKGAGRGHIITSQIEHKSVLSTCEYLAKTGVEVSFLPVEKNGLIDPKKVAREIRPDTSLVSIMMANNEIGVINPIGEIGEICRQKGVLFHTDAAQAVGKIPIDVAKMNVDILSLSAHKFYGPKGIGAIYLRHEIADKVEPLIHGGGQERGRRSGTHNVPCIVGMAKALAKCADEMETESARLKKMRDHIWERLNQSISDIKLNGDPDKRLPHNLHLTIPGVESEDLMIHCKDLAFSATSACSSDAQGPGHVLTGLGLSPEQINCSFRLSIGRFTGDDCAQFLCDELIATVKKMRSQ